MPGIASDSEYVNDNKTMKIDDSDDDSDDSDDSVLGKTRLRHLRARPAFADSLSHRRV